MSELVQTGQFRLLESFEKHIVEEFEDSKSVTGLAGVKTNIKTALEHFPELAEYTITVAVTHEVAKIMLAFRYSASIFCGFFDVRQAQPIQFSSGDYPKKSLCYGVLAYLPFHQIQIQQLQLDGGYMHSLAAPQIENTPARNPLLLSENQPPASHIRQSGGVFHLCLAFLYQASSSTYSRTTQYMATHLPYLLGIIPSRGIGVPLLLCLSKASFGQIQPSHVETHASSIKPWQIIHSRICQEALEYRENHRNYIQKAKEWLEIND